MQHDGECDSIFSELQIGMKAMRSHMKSINPEPVMKVKLPFKCSATFVDPHHWDHEAGYWFNSWPHDCDNNEKVYTFSVCLRDAKELPSKTKTVRKGALNVDPDLASRYDS